MNTIDDIPVAGENGAYNLEAQIAQAELEMQKKKEEEEQEFFQPYDKKILSKNWKCRKSALDDINKLLTSNSFSSELFKIFPQVLQEQHQTNLEQGVDCLNLYYEKTNGSEKESENNSILINIAKLLIEKGYTSSKSNLREKSKNALLKTVEKLPSTEGLCEMMINMINTKNQKIIQGVVEISKVLLIEFGSHAFAYKIIFPPMIKIVDGAMPIIKNEIIDFGKELYCWIRGNIKVFIENKVKETIQQDFTKAFEGSDSIDMAGLVPKRCLKGQTLANMPKIVFPKEDKNDAMVIDEPTKEVDLFSEKSNFNEKWCEDIIAPERKWKEKKEMLDTFIEASQNVIIKNTSRTTFIEAMKQLLKEPNINVVHNVIIVLGNLAKGLKSDFNEGKDLFILLLDFFKEKKEKFSADLFNTLSHIYTFNDNNSISELVLKYSLQILPTQSKEKVSQLISKITQEKLSNPDKNYLEILIKYSDDPSLEVRTAGMKALAIIKVKYKSVKEIDALPDAKLKKIEEYVYLQSLSEGSSEQPLPQHMQVSTKNNNSTNNNTTQAPAKPKKQAPAAATTSNPIEDTNEAVGDDEMDDYIKDKLGNELFNRFNENAWVERKEAFISLSEFIIDNKDDVNSHLEFYLKFIFLRTKKYKESNVHIIKEGINCLLTICENCPSFSKKQSQVLINRLIDKISDHKLKAQIQSLYIKFIEYHGPKYIINNIIKSIEGKSAIILKEVALILSKSIEEFDINSFPVKEIVEFCKCLVSNTNPQVRTTAISLLCNLYKYLGEPIKAFLTDIKEATKKIIDEEFSKVTVIVSVETNKRELKGEAAKEAKPKGNLMDTAFPRVDISKKITPKMIKDLLEGKWKVIKEVIDAVDGIILEANKRILPNGLFDFLSALKQKLKDGNKNTVRSLIQFITRLIEAINTGFKTHLKILIGPILKNLSDKMNLLREDIVKCLEKLIEIIGFDAVACYFPSFLAEENFELRTELLRLLLKYKDSIGKFDGIKEFIPPVISCLLDKGPSVRAMGEEYVKEILRYVPINNFYPHLKEYKPAIANSVKLIIEKYSSLIGSNIGNINCLDMNVEMKDCSNPVQQQNPKDKNNRQNPHNKNKQENLIEKRVESKSIDPRQNKIILQAKSELDDMLNIPSIKPADLMFLNIKRKPSFEITTQEVNLQMNPVYQKTLNNNTNHIIEPIPEMKNFELSKSPLLLMQRSRLLKDETCSKELSFINEKIDQEQLSVLISTLYTADISFKIHALNEIGNLFTSPSVTTNLLIEKNIRDILTAMNTLISSIFECFNNHNIMSNNINQPVNSLRCLLSSYYKISICKVGLSTVAIDTIYCTYERLLISMLTDNLETIAEGKTIIKCLNSLMVKLIENFPITNSYIALLRLISNYKSNATSRVCNIGIKCLLKLTTIMKEIYSDIDVEKLLIAMFEFLYEYEKTYGDINPRNQNEEMCLKIIKNILNELIKNAQDSIWTFYKNGIEKNNLPDKHLRKWIQLIRRSNNGISQPLPQNMTINQIITSMPLNTNENRIDPSKMQISPVKSNSTLTTNLLASFNKEDTSKMAFINEIKQYVNKISFSKDQRERETNIYEIVSTLKRNKLNVEYMADKMNENDYAFLLKVFRSIDDTNVSQDRSKSIKSINESKPKPFLMNEKENHGMNPPNISGLSLLQHYRQKLYGTNDSNTQVQQSSSNIGGVSNENLTNVSTIDKQLEEMKQKREKLDESTKKMMTSNMIINNANVVQKTSSSQSQKINQTLQNNQNIINFNNMESIKQIDRINEMKRKLDSLRGHP